MKSLWFGIVIVFSVCAADVPVRELTTQAVLGPRSIVPVFRHGYLVTFPPGAQSGAEVSLIKYGFSAWAPNGSLAYQKSIEVPDGSQPVVEDVDFNPDGSAVVAATASGNESKFISGLLLLDRTGGETGFTSTGTYLPGHLAIAPDGSVWTLGWQRNREDYKIVRQFSAEGKELKALLPRSLFPRPGLEPGSPGAGAQIAVTGDRVDVLALSGETSETMELVELDWDGNVLYRIRTGGQIARMAITDDGRVFLSGLSGDLYKLDRAARTWKLVWKAEPLFMGADGKDLVFEKLRRERSAPIALQWFNAP